VQCVQHCIVCTLLLSDPNIIGSHSFAMRPLPMIYQGVTAPWRACVSLNTSVSRTGSAITATAGVLPSWAAGSSLLLLHMRVQDLHAHCSDVGVVGAMLHFHNQKTIMHSCKAKKSQPCTGEVLHGTQAIT
jgi:hypothetical protein